MKPTDAKATLAEVLQALWTGRFPTSEPERWLFDRLRDAYGDLGGTWLPPPDRPTDIDR